MYQVKLFTCTTCGQDENEHRANYSNFSCMGCGGVLIDLQLWLECQTLDETMRNGLYNWEEEYYDIKDD